MTLELNQRLSIGPIVLLLGQDYLRADRTSHPLLDILSQRYPDIPAGANSLNDYLPKLASEEKGAILAWLHRRSQKIPISESLAILGDFAWNHVYTSAIDEVWVRAFRKPWRSLYSIFTEKSWPQDIRDRHRLCSTFLFGCVDKEDVDSRIPRDEIDELDGRRQIAVSLLRRLPDILTPRGVLLIDGWNPATDWLSSKDAYPVLSGLGQQQVFVFGATAHLKTDTRLARLQASGILTFVEQSLAEALSAAACAGDLTLGDPGAVLPNGRQITVNGQPAFIPKDTFLELEPFATILDDNLMLPPRSLPKEREYFEFLRFLEEPVKLRNWDAYARGFPFQRDFSFNLSGLVEKCLVSPKANQGPILLHGETGTGKTVALAALAHLVASKAEFPVVFIERSSKNVGSEEHRKLDRFLNWLEDAGADAALIVWDGMRDLDDYSQMWSRLTAQEIMLALKLSKGPIVGLVVRERDRLVRDGIRDRGTLLAMLADYLQTVQPKIQGRQSA
jgi:hypothetical protein